LNQHIFGKQSPPRGGLARKCAPFSLLKLAAQFTLFVTATSLAFSRQFDPVATLDPLDQTTTIVVHHFVEFVSYWHRFAFI